MANRAEALTRLGRWTDAEQLLTEAIDAGLSPRVVLSALLTIRGTLAALSGRYDDAARDMKAASTVISSRQEEHFALPFAFLRTLVAWGRGDIEQAREVVGNALTPRD